MTARLFTLLVCATAAALAFVRGELVTCAFLVLAAAAQVALVVREDL